MEKKSLLGTRHLRSRRYQPDGAEVTGVTVAPTEPKVKIVEIGARVPEWPGGGRSAYDRRTMTDAASSPSPDASPNSPSGEPSIAHADVDVVVVGAGLAGLAAATAVHRVGRSVAVIEASDGLGGRVRSDHVDGFILDRGFQILLTAYPEVQRQLDLAGLDLHAFNPGALLWHDGAGHEIGDPFRNPRTLLDTARSPMGTLRDKATVLRLRQRVRRGDARQLLRNPESTTVDHLHDLGFSPTAVARFLGPLFAGIQLDPELGTSSRMFDIIFRSLSEGDSAVPAGGMGAIPIQLARHLPSDAISLSTPAVSVRPREVATSEGTISARHVIVATSGPVASELLDLPEPESRPVGCVWFSAAASPVSSKSIVLDSSSSGPALNVAVLSDVAPTYAPADRSLIAAACPADIGPDLEDRVRAQLGDWFGSVVETWETLRVDRIAHGQPGQRPPFSPKKQIRLDDGLWVCGDHRDTGSIQGAMYSGRRCGEAVAAELVAQTITAGR